MAYNLMSACSCPNMIETGIKKMLAGSRKSKGKSFTTLLKIIVVESSQKVELLGGQ